MVQVGDNAVAVIGDTFYQAKTALASLPIVWMAATTPRSPAQRSRPCSKEGLGADQTFVGNKQGDAKAGLAGAAKTVEAVYSYPFQAHATMEPMNATARYTPDKCEVWCRPRTAKRPCGLRGRGRVAGRKMRSLQARPRAAASAGAA